MGIKLWHDDVRPAPHGWVWVQNNNDAKLILANVEVDEISMDHDLGAVPYGEAGIMARGWDEDNGYLLAQWMCQKGCVPPKVTVHSWNPVGAEKMVGLLEQYAKAVREMSVFPKEIVVQRVPFDPAEHGYV